MDTDELLRVTQIRAQNLLGRYKHIIDVKMGERATIIHGPNGIGKTVLLRLTAATFSGRMSDLTKVPFEIFAVTLSDGSEIEFDRRPEVGSPESQGRLVY